jgi:hypothetical protein
VNRDPLSTRPEARVADIIFLAVIVAFFMLCVGYVAICGRIIGPDVIAEVEADDDELSGEVRLERAA